MRRCAVELTGRNSVNPSITPNRAASRYSFTRSSDDVLAAVDADDVARDPAGVGMGEHDDGAGDVVGRGEPAARVAAPGPVEQPLVARDLLGGRRGRHAGA